MDHGLAQGDARVTVGLFLDELGDGALLVLIHGAHGDQIDPQNLNGE